MPLGSCCTSYNNNFYIKTPKSIIIEGVQQSLILNLEIIQTFENKNDEKEEDISYIFPNDNKLCIYDTIFMIGNSIIKPKLTTREEADEIYMEAVENHNIAMFASNIAGGLTEFKIGKLPPKTELKIIIKIAFTGHLTSHNTFFFKFPLEVCTPSGSKGCIYNNSNFLFKIQCDRSTIENVNSNVSSGKFDAKTKIFSISKKVLREDSILIKFKTYENIPSSILVAPEFSNIDYCAVLISSNSVPSLMNSTKEIKSKEFIFVVDCSGSMNNSIKKASECLEVFIKSLPQDSFFNIIFFGSKFNTLFDNSVKYDSTTSQKAIDTVRQLKADLGGTNLIDPLRYIFGNEVKHDQRQIFILTDGEVYDNDIILSTVTENAKNNRCFTVGLGNGCDAGLVEGIANCSGGTCSFVSDGDSISEKVIPQLKSSFSNCLKNIEIHLEGEKSSSFLISPYPIPPITFNGSTFVYLQNEKINASKSNNVFSNGMLICGTIGDENVEFQIDKIIENISEDESEFSKRFNIGYAIRALFSFNYLQKYEKMSSFLISKKDKQDATRISLSSGILSKYTAFYGCIDSCEIADEKIYRAYSKSGYSFYSHPTFVKVQKVEDHFEDFDEEFEDDEEEDLIENNDSSIVKSNSFDLMEMLRCQKFDGYWENLSEVNRIANTNIESIKNICIDSDQSLRNKCICTLIAIAAIRVFSPENQNTWNIIVEKAEFWLKKILPNENIDEIILETEKIIKNE